MNITKRATKRAFTLTEVVLAIGVVGVLIVVFMAMFVPARKTVQSALTMREADRLVNALSTELADLRNTERASANARKSSKTEYTSAFDKAFYWMQATKRPGTTILIYNYRADLTKTVRKDGTPQPRPETSGNIPGKNTAIVTGVCLATNKTRYEDFNALVGPVFAVRMTQLVVDRMGTGLYGYKLAPDYGTIYNPYKRGQVIKEPDKYVYDFTKTGKGTEPAWGAEVLYQAEFFQVGITDPERLKNMDWDSFKTPVLTRNMAFRR